MYTCKFCNQDVEATFFNRRALLGPDFKIELEEVCCWCVANYPRYSIGEPKLVDCKECGRKVMNMFLNEEKICKGCIFTNSIVKF